MNIEFLASSTKALSNVFNNPFVIPKSNANNKIAKVTVKPDNNVLVLFMLIL